MGIWDFISGTTDSLKRIYGYGSATVTYVGNAARSNVNQYLRAEEGRAKIVQLGKNIIKHTTNEGLKTLPGYKILARSLRDLNVSDKREVDVKALQAHLLKLEKELSVYKKPHKQVQMDKSVANQKPENVIKFLNDLTRY